MKATAQRIFVVLAGFFIACAVGFLGGFIYEGGKPGKLIIPGVFITLIFMPLGAVLGSFGPRGMRDAITCAWVLLFSATPKPLTSSQTILFETWKRLTYLAGFISALFQLVNMMSCLNGDRYMLGFHLGAILISILFALFLNASLFHVILSRSEWLAADGKRESPCCGYILGSLISILFLIPGLMFAFFLVICVLLKLSW